MKYRIEANIETKTSLTTVKLFNNANDLKQYIKSLDENVWYIVEYAKTHQEILRHNYNCEDTKYNDIIICPKILQCL